MLAFRLNILRHAVCAACGADPDSRFLHLCRGRAAYLARATIPEMEMLPEPARIQGWSHARLRRLGRLSMPVLRRGDGPLQPLDWNDAAKLAASRLGDGGRIVDGGRAPSEELRWVRDRLEHLLSPGPATLTIGPTEPTGAFRAHIVEFLDPRVLRPADEVLLLPASSRWSQAGGSTWATPTGRVYSPEIRGNPVPGARPDWWILAAVGRRLEPKDFAFDGADELREQAGDAMHCDSKSRPR